MKALITGIVVALLSVASLSGCNTVRGAGQDVANTGHAITRSVS